MPQSHFDGITMPFGKHEGETLEGIVEDDIGYARWCVGNLDHAEIAGAFAVLIGERERQR